MRELPGSLIGDLPSRRGPTRSVRPRESTGRGRLARASSSSSAHTIAGWRRSRSRSRSVFEAAGLTDSERAVAELQSRCEELGEGPLPQTLVHGDLHPWNVMVDGDDLRIFDWSDACVSHPLFDLPTFLQRADDESARESMLETYLGAWADLASLEELRAVYELALPLAHVHHAISLSADRRGARARRPVVRRRTEALARRRGRAAGARHDDEVVLAGRGARSARARTTRRHAGRRGRRWGRHRLRVRACARRGRAEGQAVRGARDRRRRERAERRVRAARRRGRRTPSWSSRSAGARRCALALDRARAPGARAGRGRRLPADGSLRLAADDEERDELEEEYEALRADGFAAEWRDELRAAREAGTRRRSSIRRTACSSPRAWCGGSPRAPPRPASRSTSTRESPRSTRRARRQSSSRRTAIRAASLGELEGLIVPTRGQVIATEPIPERFFEMPHYGRHGFDYWHQAEDGRIVAGRLPRRLAPGGVHRRRGADAEGAAGARGLRRVAGRAPAPGRLSLGGHLRDDLRLPPGVGRVPGEEPSGSQAATRATATSSASRAGARRARDPRRPRPAARPLRARAAPGRRRREDAAPSTKLSRPRSASRPSPSRPRTASSSSGRGRARCRSRRSPGSSSA